MFVPPARRTSYCCLCQTYSSYKFFKLTRKLCKISNGINKVNVSSKKGQLKIDAIKRNVENKQLFGPIISQKKKDASGSVDNDAFELDTAQRKILNDVVKQSLLVKVLNANGKSVYVKDVETVNPDQSHWTWLRLKRNPFNINSKNFEPFFDKKNLEPTEFLFPLYNILPNKTKEEAVIHFKSRIPGHLCIGKDVVTSSHILESTRSNKELPGNQKMHLSEEAKHILETNLSPHLAIYLENKCPSGFGDPDLPEDLLGYWKSLQPVMEKVTKVQGLEVKTTHPVLFYASTADIICKYNKSLVMMDWKSHLGLTNSSLHVSDYSLQSMACIGALNFDVNHSFQRTLQAASVISYSSGKPAHVLIMKSQLAKLHWVKWLQRLAMFYRGKTEQQM